MQHFSFYDLIRKQIHAISRLHQFFLSYLQLRYQLVLAQLQSVRPAMSDRVQPRWALTASRGRGPLPILTLAHRHHLEGRDI